MLDDPETGGFGLGCWMVPRVQDACGVGCRVVRKCRVLGRPKNARKTSMAT